MTLPNLSTAQLLVVDLQEKLVPAMHPDEQPRLRKCAANLIHAARHFGARVTYSEQYPQGLGPTLPELAALLLPEERLEKLDFSVCRAAPQLPLAQDLILIGVEAHVCVLLTALDLLAQGKRVWVPLDAIASRDPEHKQNALAMMQAAGAHVINTESLLFSQIGAAGSETFKKFSKLMR